MIFATDLDKTMIYYKTYINEQTKNKVNLIETIDNRAVSYISKVASKNLKIINNMINVVPTTTRSIDEFNNINCFEYCKYAIVSNGGIILENKKILDEWKEHVDKILINYKNEFEKVIKLLANTNGLINSKPQILDNVYVFARIENKEKCEDFFKNKIDDKMWNFCAQRKKIYIIPKEITKSNAIMYLKKKLDSGYVLAAGDSIMDKDMLDVAKFSFVPTHGELYIKYKDFLNTNTQFVQEGVFAADEITERILNIIKKEGAT